MSDQSVTQRPLTSEEVAIYYAARLPRIKQVGSQWRGPCPLHHGQDDNFAIDPNTGHWYCHSQCCRGGDVFLLEQELQKTDFAASRSTVFRLVGRVEGGRTPQTNSANLLPHFSWDYLRERTAKFASAKKLRHLTNFLYHDSEGKVCFVKAKFIDSASAKTFQVYALTSRGGWTTPKRANAKLPLYNLHLLRGAKEVHLCNGEKAADAGSKLGVTTTCAPMGEGHWDDSFTVALVGKTVFVYLDNDPTGEKHGQVVARALAGHAEVRLVRLPNLPAKGDLCDWIEAGGSLVALQAVLDDCASLQDPFAVSVSSGRSGLNPEEDQETPFRITENAVVYCDPDPEKQPIRICGRLEIVAKTRSRDSEEWGRLLRWRDDDGVTHEWAMPVSLLQGDGAAFRERLAAGGLYIAPGSRTRQLLTNYLQTQHIEARALCVSQIGWYGDSFVLPTETIGKTGDETVLLQTDLPQRHSLSTSGTIEDWRTHVGMLCTGNSRLVLAASSGFAGSLLALVGAESGGVHFYGASSTGKSTALIVGGSVCGGGPTGFVNSWRATANGLESVASLHNDLTLFLDELAQMDPRDAAEMAYLLGNGHGKARMNKAIGLRKRVSWRTLIVSAGELTLADHALAGGRQTKGGAEARLLNVPADALAGLGMFENLHGVHSADAFSRMIKQSALRYYGTPLRAFLEHLTSNRAAVESRLRSFLNDFLAKNVDIAAAGEVFRAASRFALIGVAGEIATELSLTGWREGESLASAERCFSAWLETRGTSGPSDVEAGIRQVRAFIEANGSSRFQSLQPRGARNSDAGAEKIVNRAGFRIDSKDGETQYLILSEAFRREVCSGFDHRIIGRALAERGHLVLERGPHLTVRKVLPEFGMTRVYAIKASICGGEE